MTWTQRLLIAQMGTLFGALSLYAIISGYEYYLGAAMVLASGIIASKLASRSFFKEGFILGFFIWWFAILVQGIFIDIYLENSPQIEDIKALDLPLGVQAATLLGGTLLAVGFGFLSGIVAHTSNLVRLRLSR